MQSSIFAKVAPLLKERKFNIDIFVINLSIYIVLKLVQLLNIDGDVLQYNDVKFIVAGKGGMLDELKAKANLFMPSPLLYKYSIYSKK